MIQKAKLYCKVYNYALFCITKKFKRSTTVNDFIQLTIWQRSKKAIYVFCALFTNWPVVI